MPRSEDDWRAERDDDGFEVAHGFSPLTGRPTPGFRAADHDLGQRLSEIEAKNAAYDARRVEIARLQRIAA